MCSSPLYTPLPWAGSGADGPQGEPARPVPSLGCLVSSWRGLLGVGVAAPLLSDLPKSPFPPNGADVWICHGGGSWHGGHNVLEEPM